MPVKSDVVRFEPKTERRAIFLRQAAGIHALPIDMPTWRRHSKPYSTMATLWDDSLDAEGKQHT